MKKLFTLAAWLCAAGLYAQSQEYVTPLNEVAVEKNQSAVALGGGITGGSCAAGEFVISIDTDGVPTCDALPAAAGAVSLQGAYPGTPDSGHANITGTYGSTHDNIHATLGNFGLSLENNQAALVGQTQEYSPGIRLLGAAWDTDGAVSNTNAWQVFARPNNGNTTSVDLAFYASLAGGAYAQKAFLDSAGKLSLGDSGTSVGELRLYNATSGSITITPAAGALGTVTLTAPATSGTILQSGTDVTLAQIVPASAASVMLGRGSAGGAGDFQEITLGNGLSMSSQVLSTDPNAKVAMPYWFDDFTGYRSAVSSSCGDLAVYRTDQGAGSVDGAGVSCGASTYDHPGVLNLTTDDSATGYASVSRSNADAFGFGAGMTFEALVQIPTLSVTASEGFTLRVGLCDSLTVAGAASCSDGISFWYSDNINGGEWEARTYKGGAANVNTLDTNIAVVAGTWYKLKWVYSAGPSVEFFICSTTGPCLTSVGTINTAANIPGSTDYATFNIMLAKTVGTTARTANLDYWWLQMTAAR